MEHLSRFVWWAAERVLVILLITGLCVGVFFWAMNTSSINIILKDGMALRAKVIIMDSDSSTLNKYFRSTWLERDANLQQALRGESPYKLYTIRGIDHRISTEFFFCMPWAQSVVVYFTESVPHMDGRVNGNYADYARQLYGENYRQPPAWPTMRYAAKLVKENGQWHIHSLTPATAP